MSRRRIARCGAGRLCAIFFAPRTRARSETRSTAMKVSDILRFKGGTLFTATPELALAEAVQTMAGNDIGSLVVMAHGRLAGMLTFREVIAAVVRNRGSIGGDTVESVMEREPLTAG